MASRDQALADCRRRTRELREKLEEAEEIIASLRASQAAADELRLERAEPDEPGLQRAVELEAANTRLREEAEHREWADQVLRASEERFRTVAEHTYDCEYWAAPDGRLVYISPACERLTGYTREEFLAHPDLLNELVHPDDRDSFASDLLRWVPQGQIEAVDFRIVRKDGQTRWISHASHPIYSPTGHALGRRGSNRDVTRRKVAELERERLLREVRVQHELLDAVVESAPAAFLVVDGAELRVKWCCEAYRMIFPEDRRAKIAPGASILDFVPNAEETGVAGVFRAAVATRQTQMQAEFEYAGLPQGTTHWRWVVVPLPCEADATPDALSVLIDVTEQVRARQHIEALASRAEQRAIELDTVIDSIADAVVIYTASGEVGRANASAQRMSGLGLDEMKQGHTRVLAHMRPTKPDGTLFAPEEMPSRLALAGEIVTGVTVLLQPRLGEVVWTSVSAAPLRDSKRQIVGAVVTFSDITERVTVEEELRRHRDRLGDLVDERTHELQTANEQMAAEIAERMCAQEELLQHQGTLRSLASELVLAEERERRAIATGIHDEISQPLAFARMRVSLAKATTSRDDLNKHLTDLDQTLMQVVQTSRTLTFEASPPVLYQLGLGAALDWLAENMRTRGIAPVTYQAVNAPLPLAEDMSVLLFQIVRELLANAAKHAKADHVTVTAEWSREQIRIEVADDGVGFAQPTGPVTGKGGFGLFNTTERISHMGGSLHIDSTPGAGTRFTITAPREPE